MGFYVTDAVESCPAVKAPPSKNRVWNFFSASRSRAGFSAAQPVEPHWENEPTPTIIVSGMSCWLSRDPIGEPGHVMISLRYFQKNYEEEKNLYLFARNNSLNLVDPNGESALPILLLMLVDVTWNKVCMDFAIEGARQTFPDDDKQQHCYASCYHVRCKLGLGPFETFIGGIWHEIRTPNNDWSDAWGDIKANIYGIISAYSFSSCKDKCKCPPQ